uniref:Inosine/uridine-preferring nucleoside hydrolase n=2 Tax=Rubinisphaera brasiliensis TaxID=119 RepID=F0SIT6_RUBBR|nr:Inosine/uridine-preferring nucleoside hydrolase [Rubinisphaera brasiliensis DSM 5305]
MQRVCLPARTRLAAALMCFAITCLSNDLAAAEPVPVIFDTDMANDCDDAGALAVLNALADNGEANILAVVTNRKCPSGVSGAACDAINTYYGRGDIPIGTDKDGAKVPWKSPSSYTPILSADFPHDSDEDASLPDALTVYRKTLAAAADNSVVICSVGALSNLEDLLNSPGDEHSPLTGKELITRKVQRTVIMGAAFPRSARPETNIRLDPPAAVAVVCEWPGEIIWQGYEVGAALHCGQSLLQVPEDNPVRRAFELRPFLGKRSIDRGKPAHDQAAVLLAVRGIDEKYWRQSPFGRVVIDSDSHSEWKPQANGRHCYVAIEGHPDDLAGLIDELMTQPPRQRTKGTE